MPPGCVASVAATAPLAPPPPRGKATMPAVPLLGAREHPRLPALAPEGLRVASAAVCGVDRDTAGGSGGAGTGPMLCGARRSLPPVPPAPDELRTSGEPGTPSPPAAEVELNSGEGRRWLGRADACQPAAPPAATAAAAAAIDDCAARSRACAAGCHGGKLAPGEPNGDEDVSKGDTPNEPPSRATLEQLVRDEPTEVVGDWEGVGPLDPLRPPPWLLPPPALRESHSLGGLEKRRRFFARHCCQSCEIDSRRSGFDMNESAPRRMQRCTSEICPYADAITTATCSPRMARSDGSRSSPLMSGITTSRTTT